MQDVVGLGGSAGSIDALETFFSQMPEDSGLAFVVVLHLSPEYESGLRGVLQKWTVMPVIQVSEPIKVESAHCICPSSYVVMHSVLTPSGGTTNGPGSRIRGATAIDILMQPDATMLKHAAADNARLLKLTRKASPSMRRTLP
jgi:two-component system CheB/CheR fusion protein